MRNFPERTPQLQKTLARTLKERQGLIFQELGEGGLQHEVRMIESFIKRAARLSDEEFETELRRINAEIDKHTANTYRTGIPWWRSESTEKFQANKGDIRKIRSREEFREKVLMDWIPQKIDIARFVQLAITAHELRVTNGEISEGEPISVLDIGGGNGSLGHLMTHLGSQNDLKINYTVVDPDQEITAYGQSLYSNELKFINQDAQTFTEVQYENDSEINHLMQQRKLFIERQQKKLQDLYRLFDWAFQLRDLNKLNKTKIKYLAVILNEHFEIQVPDECTRSPKSFMDFLEGASKDNADIWEQWLSEKNKTVKDMDMKIENILIKRPARHDLVINSWMPHEMDFTNFIREANGAVIIYVYSRDGSTGIRRDALHSRKVKKVGQDYSYLQGVGYLAHMGWLGYSTYPVQEMSYVNGVAVHVKRPYSNLMPATIDTSNLKPGEDYPWEAIEDKKHQPVSLRIDEGVLSDNLAVLDRLAKRLDPYATL